MDAFMRPASGNTYDLRPATSCAEGGRGRRQNWQDGGYDVRGSSDHSGNETKQVRVPGFEGVCCELFLRVVSAIGARCEMVPAF